MFKIAEVFRFFNRNFYVFLATTLQTTVCLFVCTLLACNSFVSNMNVNKFDDFFINREFYLMTDNGDDDGSYQQYMESTDDVAFNNLSAFIDELRNQTNFSFASVVSQPLTFASEDVADSQFNDVENGIYDTKHTNIRCVQISENIFDLFDLSLLSGRIFTEDDFVLTQSKPVAVLLGSDYQKFYQIGDVFFAEHGIERLSFIVIGFLNDGSIIPEGGRLVNLSTYMVIPAFSSFDLKSYHHYARINLSQQANGFIICERKGMDISDYVNQLSVKYSTFNFTISPIVSNNANEISFLSKDIVEQLSMLSIVVFIFSVISIVITMYSAIKKDRHILGTHYLCGARQRDIMHILANEILIIVLISLLLASLMIDMLHIVHPILIIGSISIYGTVLFMIVFGLSWFFMHIMSVDQLLRRNH